MENRFYVYVYLDTRYPGIYRCFGKRYVFDFRPFYVGKGTGSRYRRHLLDAKKGKTGSQKLHILRAILSLGLEPKIVKVEDFLDSYTALCLESYIRDYIGTTVEGTGYLSNVLLRDDLEWTDELRDKKSKSISGENHPFFGTTRTQEEKDKISKTISDQRKNWSEEQRKTWSVKREGELNPNFGKQMSLEQRKKISDSRKGELNPNWGKPISPEQKQKIREAVSGDKNGMYGVKGEDHPWWHRNHSKESKRKQSKSASNPDVHNKKMKSNIMNRIKEIQLAGLVLDEENFNKFRNAATPLFKNILKYISKEEINHG